MSTRVPTGRRRSRLIFLSSLVGLALVAYRVALRDPGDGFAVILITAIAALAAVVEWPELDRIWRARASDAQAVDRLEKIITDEAPPPTQGL